MIMTLLSCFSGKRPGMAGGFFESELHSRALFDLNFDMFFRRRFFDKRDSGED